MQQIKNGLFLFILWLPSMLIAQHSLQEAIKLTPYFETAGSEFQVFLKEAATLDRDTSTGENTLRPDVQKILAPYTGGMDNMNQETINAAFDNGNPFIVLEYTSNFGLNTNRLDQSSSNGTPPLGGNPVSSIADGIARFLVKRTKQELSLAFFADFKQAILADKKSYFKHFFKNTQQTLLVIDTEVYQFQIYLEALREAFKTDLRFLPGNLEEYLREAPVDILKPAQQSIATDLFHIVQMTIDGEPSIDLLRYLANDSESDIQMNVGTEPELKNLAAGLHLANHISESLFNPETGKWYTGREIKKALANPVTLRLYLGLLWHHSLAVQAPFGNGATIASLIAKAATVTTLMSDWQHLLANFGENAQDLEESLKARRDKFSSLSDNFAEYIQLFNQMLETANTLNNLLNPGAGDAIPPKYQQLLQQIGSLDFNAKQRHYSAAVGNMIFILDVLLGDNFEGRKELFKYGMFIAAVAESQSADEVQNAIELFALPPGSSKAKKGADKFSIAINAYTGGNVSNEHFRTESIAKSSVSAGLAAPVGFSINWGQNWGTEAKPKNASIGLFFPVIDVGAIYAYRFQNDGVQNLPPMEWKNIVAPGLYLVVDPPLGKWPLTIGLGGQMGPLLRKVEQNGVYKNKDVGGYRIGGFLTFDIPINYLKLTSGK